MGLENPAQEFKKVREPKLAKLKGIYSANATIIFNSWLKDIQMYVFEWNFSSGEAIQLMKDLTFKHARNAVEFYLQMTTISRQDY